MKRITKYRVSDRLSQFNQVTMKQSRVTSIIIIVEAIIIYIYMIIMRLDGPSTPPIPLRQDGGKEFKHHKFIVTYIFGAACIDLAASGNTLAKKL